MLGNLFGDPDKRYEEKMKKKEEKLNRQTYAAAMKKEKLMNREKREEALRKKEQELRALKNYGRNKSLEKWGQKMAPVVEKAKKAAKNVKKNAPKVQKAIGGFAERANRAAEFASGGGSSKGGNPFADFDPFTGKSRSSGKKKPRQKKPRQKKPRQIVIKL